MKKIFKLVNSIKLNWGIKTWVRNRFDLAEYFIENKLIYPVFKKFERHIYHKIVSHYGADYKWGEQRSQNLRKTSYGYGLFHYTMIRNQKPKRILCLGSMYGYIPYMMAKACEDNGYGHVDFVDAGYDLESGLDPHVHFFGQGFWPKTDLKKHFSYFLDSKYISTHLMKTAEFAQKTTQTYDYVYLDADHSYLGAKSDVLNFWPKLNSEGYLVFHDIHFQKTLHGVDFEFWKIWAEMSNQPFKLEVSNHYSGLGIIQKLGSQKLPW
ncbi:MAG TPA: hypothetical protein DEP87_03950 [Candidatus Pacebacteria bacterium]|nr:hypothetical protein [Candidatus Paceibacterota bacterium]